MKVAQHPYLSPEAMALRRRDGTPPWSVHVSEVDSLAGKRELAQLAGKTGDSTAFRAAVVAAAEMRRQIEADDR